MANEVKVIKRGRFFQAHQNYGPDNVVSDQFKRAMTETLALLEREAKERTPEGVSGARGGLRATIHGKQSKSVFGLKGQVLHQSVYGDVIELGRKPGKAPPVKFLLSWVEVKLGLKGRQAVSAAYAISRSISKRGFSKRGNVGPKGARMFEKALDRNEAKIIKIFKRAGLRVTVTLNR